MNRKGQIVMKELIKYIIAAILLMLLVTFTAEFIGVAGEAQQIEQCRLSVLVNSKVRQVSDVGNLIGGGLQGDLPIKCVASKKEIKGKRIDDQAKQIAEELRTCWYKMGEGNLEVFGRDTGAMAALKQAATYYLGTGGPIKPAAYCLVCSQFRIKEDTLRVKYLADKLKDDDFFDGKGSYLSYLDSWSLASSKHFFYGYEEYVNKEGVKSRRFQLAKGNVKPRVDYLVVFARFPETVLDRLSDWYELEKGEEVSREAQRIMVIPKEHLAESRVCQKLYWERERT